MSPADVKRMKRVEYVAHRRQMEATQKAMAEQQRAAGSG